MLSLPIRACLPAFLILTGLALGQTPARAGKLPIEENFGEIDGAQVKRYTLLNDHGMVVRVISYGATITELRAPDRDENIANIVLGSDTLEPYAKGHPAAASVIGRFANRIAKARFVLDGTEYTLPANSGPNHIHGGIKNFARVVWNSEIVNPAQNGPAVRFSYRSPDSEEGFPGNLDVSVTYTLTDSNELRLDYEARADKPTILNLTNHAYFNLAGGGDVLNHELWLAADEYTPADQEKIPTGEMASVKGTPLDFRTPVTLGARIEQLKPTGGYDHNYVLREAARNGAVFARVYEPESGRLMEVTTTQPGVQLYVPSRARDFVGVGGVHFGPHAALCLETQHYPDSPNKPQFPTTVLRPGEVFRSSTTYKFSTRSGGLGQVLQE